MLRTACQTKDRPAGAPWIGTDGRTWGQCKRTNALAPGLIRGVVHSVAGNRPAHIVSQGAKLDAIGVDAVMAGQFQRHVAHSVDMRPQALRQGLQADLKALE